jgi:serine protease Do
LAVREQFAHIVLPIEVQLKGGEYSIGSCFIYDDNTIITARHCLPGTGKFRILVPGGETLSLEAVFTDIDPNVDAAVIKLDRPVFAGMKSFSLTPKPEHLGNTVTDDANIIGHQSFVLLGAGNVLDEVLTLDYPPIPGFDSFMVSDTSVINSSIRSSSGKIVGCQNKLADSIDYFLINARVKGGNSGGPVFDRLGRVLGIVVEMPANCENPELLDSLGYGIVLPSIYLRNLIMAVKDNSSEKMIKSPITNEDSWNLVVS